MVARDVGGMTLKEFWDWRLRRSMLREGEAPPTISVSSSPNKESRVAEEGKGVLTLNEPVPGA